MACAKMTGVPETNSQWRRIRGRIPGRVKDVLRPLRDGAVYGRLGAWWYFVRAGALRKRGGHPLFDDDYYRQQVPGKLVVCGEQINHYPARRERA